MYRHSNSGSPPCPFEPPPTARAVPAPWRPRNESPSCGHLLGLPGIGLLTAAARLRKDSACRRVTDTLNPGLFRVAYVRLSTGTVIDIYQAIGWALGLDTPRYRAPACQAIRTEIRRLGEAGQLPLLILDEAQHLRHDVLDELRLLTNFGLDSERRLCLLLVGQSELRRRMAMAHHEAFAQRVVVRYHLAGLQREELEPYLAHALQRAGCELPLFEPPACQALFQASHGLPRMVSSLAHYSLAAAALDKARTVTAEHVQGACEELRP